MKFTEAQLEQAFIDLLEKGICLLVMGKQISLLLMTNKS